MKMRTILAAAGAVAFGFCAQAADPWFDAGIGKLSSWGSLGAPWSGETAAELKGDAPNAYLALINSADALTYAAATNTSAAVATFTMSVKLTAYDSAEKPQPADGAKAGIIVSDDNGVLVYNVLAAGEAANVWVAAPELGEPDIDNPVAISVRILGNNVTYVVGDKSVVKTIVSDNEIAGVAIKGMGELHALAGTTDVGYVSAAFDLAALDAKNVASFAVVQNGAALGCVTNAGKVVYSVLNGMPFDVTLNAKEGFVFGADKTYSTTIPVAGLTADGDVGIDALPAADAAKAKIGTEFYLSLNSAFGDLQDEGTITLLDNITEGGINLYGGAYEGKFPNGVTIDLNGKTWTANKGLSDTSSIFIGIYKGNKLTIENGAIVIAEAATNTLEYMYYSYAEQLTFNNVALDLRNLVKDSEDGDSRRFSAFIVQNGGLAFTGTTTVQLAEGWNLVAELDRAGSAYNMGDITIDIVGDVPGNIYLLGDGKLKIGEKANLLGDIYVGAGRWSGYTDDCIIGGDYTARVGEIRGGAIEDGKDGASEVTAKLYKTLADAFAAVEDNGTVAAIADATVDARIDIDPTKSIKFDANGKNIAVAAGVYAFVYGGGVEETGSGVLTVTGDGVFTAPEADSTMFLWARRGNIVVENGSFTMNGDSQCVYADNGCKVEIQGGTFKNLKANGDVLNVNNTRSTVADIQVAGGSFSKDPATGDDALAGSFVKAGCVSIQEGDLWTVYAQVAATATIDPMEAADWSAEGAFPTPVVTVDPDGATYTGSWNAEYPTANPEADTNFTYTVTFTGKYVGEAVTQTFTVKKVSTAEPVVPGTESGEIVAGSATEAEAKVMIVVPEGEIAEKVGTEPEAQAAYKALFKPVATAVEGKDNTYKVDIVFNEENPTVQAIQEAVTTETKAIDLGVEAVETTIDATVPGVYYQMVSGAALDNMGVTDEKLGDGGSVTLATPKDGTSGFYYIKVSATSSKVTQDE